MEAKTEGQPGSSWPDWWKLVTAAVAAALLVLGALSAGDALASWSVRGKILAAWLIVVAGVVGTVRDWPRAISRTRALAAIAAVSVGGAVLIYALTKTDEPSSPTVTSIPGVCVGPEALAQTADQVWLGCALGPNRGELRQIDIKRNEVVGKPISIPGKPHDLLVINDRIYVVTYEGHLISLGVEGRRGEFRQITVLSRENGGGDIIRTEDELVVNDWRGGRLLFIDPETLTVRPTARLAKSLVALTYAGDSIWASDSAGQTVLQLSRDGEIIARVDLPRGPNGKGADPQDLTSFDGTVFVADYSNQRVLAIDVDPPHEVSQAEYPIGFAASGIAAAGEWVWVTAAHDDRLTRIDPETGEVRSIPVGEEPVDVTAKAGKVWTADHKQNAVSVFSP